MPCQDVVDACVRWIRGGEQRDDDYAKYLSGNAIEFTNEKELEFALDNRPWGNMTWVSCADLVSKWCPMADGVSDTGVIGGKSVKEVMDLEAGEEVFMEIEGGEIDRTYSR
ncbi:hypothetical protein ACFX1W_030299 [Malus domestica]